MQIRKHSVSSATGTRDSSPSIGDRSRSSSTGFTKMICHRCKKPIVWDEARHVWTHPGGGVYILNCPNCKALYDTAEEIKTCPACGHNLWDHHCIMPITIA